LCSLQRSRGPEAAVTAGEKAISRRKRYTVGLVLAIVFLDQLTKLLARLYLQPRGSLRVVANYLRFTYVENPGMAFGIEIPNKILFNVLSFAAVLVIFYYLFKMKEHTLLRISFASILGGAFGNLTDRVLHGRVVDFIDVKFFDLRFNGANFLFFHLPSFGFDRWPVFNLADMAVTVGMFTVILSTFLPLSSETPAAYATEQDSHL